MENETRIRKAYEIAREQYAELGVDTGKAIQELSRIPVSVNCWQGDDIRGFEHKDSNLGADGILATGNFPGLPRNIEDFRQDINKAMSLIPGTNRLSLHSIYGEFGGVYVDRDNYEGEHFNGWINWAKENNCGLDFNSTCFSHEKSADGYTIASKDKGIRDFWINHIKRCREISAYIGKELNNRVMHNIWVPDGSKDTTVNRYYHRSMLKESLDEILKKSYDQESMRDTVESKLFGIGSESFVAGSSEFYLAYAMKNNIIICLDMGHFHPTESVADKISSVLLFADELMLHVSRPVRWDSDHVVTYSDELNDLCREVTRAGAINTVNFGLDFFDASINRVGAWVVGTRSLQKSLLSALLEPIETLREYEAEGKLFERLALLEESKNKPFGAVWDFYCMSMEVPVGHDYIGVVQEYERKVLSER